jgi:hypothetical protein
MTTSNTTLDALKTGTVTPSRKTYNGHHCWNCWNVALWISNDESLYREALDAKARQKTLRGAAEFLITVFPEKTPDGAKFTVSAIKRALEDL